MFFTRFNMVKNYKKGVPGFTGNRIHWLSVSLVDFCNFNCARCGYFSPLAKQNKFPDKNQIISDLTRMAELTKDNPLDDISLSGGEPLLSPDLIEYLTKTRELFPNISITLQTNGILIPKMSDEFFETVKKCNININISIYRQEEFYKDIFAKIKEKDCENHLYLSKDERYGCVLFNKCQLSYKCPYSSEVAWEYCAGKDVSVELKNGKLYTCATIAHIDLLNNYFGEHFEVTEDDYIDIYKHSYNEIMDYLKKPKPFCKYCGDDDYEAMYLPEKSQRDRSEWMKIYDEDK